MVAAGVRVLYIHLGAVQKADCTQDQFQRFLVLQTAISKPEPEAADKKEKTKFHNHMFINISTIFQAILSFAGYNTDKIKNQAETWPGCQRSLAR